MAISIHPGIPIKLFDALTTTADTKSNGYGIPNNWPSMGRPMVWQTIMNGSPSAISLQLQGAMNDTDAEYAVLDSSTSTSGEMRHVLPLNIRFVRVRQVSRTGATDVTVQVLI